MAIRIMSGIWGRAVPVAINSPRAGEVFNAGANADFAGQDQRRAARTRRPARLFSYASPMPTRLQKGGRADGLSHAA
jgi:hypothetical protein